MIQPATKISPLFRKKNLIEATVLNKTVCLSSGLWSLIKRAPKAKVKRKTFEVAGPSKEGAMPLDARAKQIFSYFKNYNYVVKSTGEVIVFEGNYKASISE